MTYGDPPIFGGNMQRMMAQQDLHAAKPVAGCVCPPGANKECENPLCPRKPIGVCSSAAVPYSSGGGLVG